MLLCNAAQVSSRPTIFLIDEPELSLNVSWQRLLIDTLRKLSSGNVQFVMATHSLELLSRHRPNMAKLENTSSRKTSKQTAASEVTNEE